MTPWTALLESLHSSLIDELTELHPEPKPILGMPTWQRRIQLPQLKVTLVLCEFEFGSQKGLSLLTAPPDLITSLRTTPMDLWSSILKCSEKEFCRRKISPKIGVAHEFPDCDALPLGYVEPRGAIWIPFEIPAGKMNLGLGVC